MSQYLGDFAAGATIYHHLNTNQSDGTPSTLGGTPAVKIYKDGSSTTEVPTGVSVSIDFDSFTGLHLLTVNTAADGTFFAAGHDYHAVLTVGTVNGVSVPGRSLAHFSIQNRYQTQSGDAYTRLGAPAGASISADLAVVQARTANIPAVPADQPTCTANTNAIMARIGAPVGASISADLATKATPTNITAGTLTTVTNLTNAPTAGDFTATMKASLNNSTPTSVGTVDDKAGYKLASDGLNLISTARASGLAANFREMIVEKYWHFFGKVTMTSTQKKTYNGSTVLTTQALTDDGTTQTQGLAS